MSELHYSVGVFYGNEMYVSNSYRTKESRDADVLSRWNDSLYDRNDYKMFNLDLVDGVPTISEANL